MTTLQKKKSPANAIVEGVIWKQLLIFFFPILLGTFFQQLYNTVDTIIVGKFAGKEALAAVGSSAASLINLITGFFIGLSSGATVIISQYFGAKNDRDVNRTVHTSMAIAVVFALVIMVLGIALSPWLLRILNTPEDIIPPTLEYINIFFAGMIPSLVYNIGSGILRAIGDSKRPLYFLIIACVINAMLDIAFVAGMNMGVGGAALATVIAQTVCAVLVMLVLMRSREAYHLQLKKIRFHGDLMKPILRIGLPAGIQATMFNFSNLLIQGNINSFGTNTVAGWSAWMKLEGIVWMFISSFGIAITTFVGQNFGAQKYDRMRKSVFQCWLMATIAVLASSAVMMFFGERLYHLFISDSLVIADAVKIMKFMLCFYFLFVCIEVFSGALRGAGDSLIPTVMMLFGVCVLRLIWLWGVLPNLEHNFIYTILCYPITWTITAAMFLLYYFRSDWLNRCKKKAGFL